MPSAGFSLVHSIRDTGIDLAKRYLPPEFGRWLVRQQKRFRLQWPPRGAVRFGSFRRLSPISPIFALDRGIPIDRYYIERFLRAHRRDIRGHVLEMGDDRYTRLFGGDRVTLSDVMSVVEQPDATIVADLTCADHVPSDHFDCIIFTQSLQMIFDLHAALDHLHRILKPGGTLLLTTHGISKIGRRRERDPWGEYWRLTSQSVGRLLSPRFPTLEVTSEGNVLSAMCSLHGLASEELTERELDFRDPDFEVIIAARAVKSADT